MKRSRNRILFAIVIPMLFAASQSLAAGTVGDRAPDFSATTLEGKALSLAEYRGKTPVYLVFWATWCPNCLREIPEINALQQKFGDRMAILSINVGINDSAEAAREYREEHGMKYPVVFDEGSRISSRYAIAGTPTQLLIGSDGVIRYRSAKTPAAADIEKHWSQLSAKSQH